MIERVEDNEEQRSVVVFSGGMDSGTLLAWAQRHGYNPHAFSVNYGQRHSKELSVGADLCRHLGVPHVIADMRNLRSLVSNSALTNSDIDVPHGHYADESMKQTVVPNRNMILIALATGYAINIGATRVFYGAHAGDHAVYPDCRKEFADALSGAMELCDYTPIQLERPFIGIRKEDIVAIGAQVGMDYSMTWSCYEGGRLHCGKCGTCVERREAFQIAKVEDPTEYQS